MALSVCSVSEFFVVGCHIDLLKFVGIKSVQIPNEFALHSNLQKLFSQVKTRKIESGEGIDWATAEAMAFGTLLLQGMFRIVFCVSFLCLRKNKSLCNSLL